MNAACSSSDPRRFIVVRQQHGGVGNRIQVAHPPLPQKILTLHMFIGRHHHRNHLFSPAPSSPPPSTFTHLPPHQQALISGILVGILTKVASVNLVIVFALALTLLLPQRAVVASWGAALADVFVPPEGGDCFASHSGDEAAAAAVAAAMGGREVLWKTLGNGGNNELAEACVCSPLLHDDDVLLLQSPHNLIPWLMSNKAFSRQIFRIFGHDVVGSIMRRCLKLKDGLQKRYLRHGLASPIMRHAPCSVDKWQQLHPSRRLIGVQMRLQLGVDSYRPPCDNLTIPDAQGRPIRTTAFVSVPNIRYAVCKLQRRHQRPSRPSSFPPLRRSLFFSCAWAAARADPLHAPFFLISTDAPQEALGFAPPSLILTFIYMRPGTPSG